MKTKRFLQVLNNGIWEYVFCRIENKNFPVTCKEFSKAIKCYDDNNAFDYFQSKFANDYFRIVKVDKTGNIVKIDIETI